MKATPVFSKNLEAYVEGKRYIINQGGTRSGKTWAILQLLFLIARERSGLIISVVSETMPHLKRGALRDFEAILQALNYPYEEGLNRTNQVYTIGTNRIEFFSADNPSRLRGAARDILYINECNNLPVGSFNELEVRTRGTVFLDYNPVSEFWVHNDLIPRINQDKYTVIRSTYRDNDTLTPEQVESIEGRRLTNPQWYQVYGLGEIGVEEGVVIESFELVDTIPAGGSRAYGLDFGYSNDPTALVEVALIGNDLYVDQLLYRTGLTNSDIAGFFKSEGISRTAEIIADSAEPKSIEDLYRAGYNVHPAVKGPDSVRQGIDSLKSRNLKVTKRSLELIKELRNYKYRTDKDGRKLNDFIDYFNHGIDAIRYAHGRLVKSTSTGIRSSFTRLK